MLFWTQQIFEHSANVPSFVTPVKTGFISIRIHWIPVPVPDPDPGFAGVTEEAI
jgi:hypothetical protein